MRAIFYDDAGGGFENRIVNCLTMSSRYHKWGITDINKVLTAMRRAGADLRFEGGPPLLQLMGGPLVPTLVNQFTPSYIFFRVEVQGRDSKHVIRTAQM